MGSMVAGDLHLVGILPFPSEDNAPLLVDTDGMVSSEPAFQRLQAVARWLAKVSIDIASWMATSL